MAFAHGADLWIVERTGGLAQRLTSTPAVETGPAFSPDGRQIAFTSNRSGVPSVYVVSVEGGTPKRLTWYPSSSRVRGWTPDGGRILSASSRETAPVGYERLWTVSPEGGPSVRVPAPWGHDAAFSADGRRLLVDRVARWDSEWRNYRGGQNTALTILDLEDLSEVRLPNERTTDIEPVWTGGKIYFLSDRDWAMNVWSYDADSGAVSQVTHFADADVKSLSGFDGSLILEQDGYIHTLDPDSGVTQQLEITVRGDFPWAEPRWEDVGERARSAALSPTGKRALFEARGEIFTVPAEKGDVRNLTRSSGAADRHPIWSPDGADVAWFTDSGEGYELLIAGQEGLSAARRLDIGESKMAWEPAWSPDGRHIAFVDDDVRVRVIEIESGEIRTIDIGGTNMERGSMGLTWSPDSKWLAYAKTSANHLRRITVWSLEGEDASAVSDVMADAISPAWDLDGQHLYFLASTDLALASGWANTSQMQVEPRYGVYLAVLQAGGDTPFTLESDEEGDDDEAEETEEGDEDADETKYGENGDDGDDSQVDQEDDDAEAVEVQIDLGDIDRRVISIPMPVSRYRSAIAGPKGSVFVSERAADGPGLKLHKFAFEERKAEVFLSGGVRQVVASDDGQKLLYRRGDSWSIIDAGAKPAEEKGGIDVSLRMHLDRTAEWKQIFDEAWRYERDFFYDPGLHGSDWDAVRSRYSPLVPHVRHRADLNYVLDQVNGELSVGHSFVLGGDLPDVEDPSVGLLGADLVADADRWRIDLIYTFESWNPNLTAPLDHAGLEIEEGHYLVGVNGVELSSADDPYRLLDGTAGRQTVLRLNDQPTTDGSWTSIVKPISSESSLRQRAWVEDNRRLVDELSDGRLAYVWVPNTSDTGVISFDRYFFAQQDKLGAVIDERFNGGGLLDDYMVDLMTRSVRAAVTNEVPDGRPFRLPAGILGPKVLLINELAGSGGDFFPWVFRQQQAGPLIGARTWGGLVKSSVHYRLIDGGALTAPDNAVFDPVGGRWIAENEGVAPDIEVLQDARAVAAGRDPQLERGVEELLRLLPEAVPDIEPPPFPRPSRRPGQ
ncbi:MAG: PDZ domain-containing protein [Acidobacteriota bacterium]|nr:PDZ domain-containing protein [Acidobacteriota bacterium]